MSSTTLALAASPSGVRSRVAWRVLLAFAGSWLVAGLAQFEIKLPLTPVPITGQTLGVLLVSASLGAGLGAVSMALYLLQGALGLPFFSGGGSGADFLALSSVTGGYLWGSCCPPRWWARWLNGGGTARSGARSGRCSWGR
jgi:biotin transport system substrate-specific component